MIELKNKFYNSKDRKKQLRLNKYMSLKGKIRLKLKSIKPLSNYEKFLYKDKNVFKKQLETVEDNRYLVFNKRIHILSVVNKNEIDKFCDGIDCLIRKNPSKGIFQRSISSEDLRDDILKYKDRINVCGWSSIGCISPTNSELKDVIDYIEIYIFDLSDDYICVSFVAVMNKTFNNELNDIITTPNINSQTNYRKYYVGRKKYFSKSYYGGNSARKDKVDNILLEVKVRCYIFLSTYIKLFPLKNRAPISLDEYATDYKLNLDEARTLERFGFNIGDDNDIYKDLDIIVNHNGGQKFNQSFQKVDFYFDFDYKKESVRNAKILLSITKENSDNFFEDSSVIQIYKWILFYYYNFELESCIVKKRKILDNAYKFKIYNVYDEYIRINQNVRDYINILGSIRIEKVFDEYSNDRVLSALKYQAKRYSYLMKKNNSMDEEFSSFIMVKSTKSSLSLSKVSIWIAIASLIVTMIFSILSYKCS